MQINIPAVNQMNLRIGDNINNSLSTQRHTNALNTDTGSVFGPQCRVTISREGRKRSEQSGTAASGSFTAGSTERLLLRQQKQSEQNKNEQSETIKEISGLMSEIRNSYNAGEDKETITNKQDALNKLLELKARQKEENEQRAKDAQSSAVGASKEQEEIDQKNADLYLMLKTLEEKEEEEQGGEGSGAESDTAETGEEQSSVSDQFQQSAAALGVSAAKRELQAAGMIDGMFQSGYGRLAEADAMMHEVHAELDLAAESLATGNLSEDERDQLMSEHIGRANAMLQSNYGEMMDMRRKGHQEIQDAQEVSLKHIAVSPLDGVDAAKQAIMEAGVTAAFHEVSQDTLDKTSAELEERVQEAVDKRNDTTTESEEDKEQVKAELEEIEEEEQIREAEEQEKSGEPEHV